MYSAQVPSADNRGSNNATRITLAPRTKMKPAAYPLNPASIGFLFLIGFVTGLQAMATTFTLPALPVMAASFATTPAIAQQTISGFLVGLSCGQIIAGAFGDRFGRRPILILGTTLFVITSFGCAFAGSIQQLIILRIIQGFAASAGMILGRAIVRDTFERVDAIRAMSTIGGIISIVPMIAPLIAGLLLPFLSWRAIFIVLAVASTVICLLIYLRIGESLRTPDPRATNPIRILHNCMEMIRRPDSISFVLIVGISYGGIYVFFTLVPFIVIDTSGLGAASAGVVLLLTSASTWIGTRFNNQISHHWSVRRALRFSTSLALVSSLILLGTTWAVANGALSGNAGLVAVVAPLLMFSFSFGVTHSTCIVMALQPVPHIAGTGSALQASFQTLGGASFAWVAAHFYNGTPVTMGIFMAISSLIAFLIFTFVATRYAPAEK